MSQPSHDRAYRSAMSAAVDELGSINEAITSLSNRMHQLDSLREALKPFLPSREQTAEEDRGPTYESIGASIEPLQANGLTPHMIVGTAIPDVGRQKLIESADPIQRRINSVLGLAVA